MNALKAVSVLGFGYFVSVLYMSVHQTETESGIPIREGGGLSFQRLERSYPDVNGAHDGD